MKQNERVCCVARADIEGVLGCVLPQGGFAAASIEQILALPQCFLPRSQAEHDPSLKQLIPYQLFLVGDRFFVYRRGGGVGESRLAGRLSLGIGGHINANDAGNGRLDLQAYNTALMREREEELLCPPGLETAFVGWINDDSDPVGQVHLGAVHLCRVRSKKDILIRPQGEDLHGEGWWDKEEILARDDSFEAWSILAVQLASGPQTVRALAHKLYP